MSTSGSNSGHEGAARPQMPLKGGMEQPHTQSPMDSEAQTNPRSASTDNVAQSWDSTSLKDTPDGNPSNAIHTG